VHIYPRKLIINLPPQQSAFLWGARQTGKTFYLSKCFPASVLYNLLETDQMLRLTKAPYLLREEIQALDKQKLAQPIIIDEIQKVPELLNEVHWLIENLKVQFILCSSSARKLRVQASNLLGGRASQYHFYPLVFAEIDDFDLLKALQHGLIPKHYLAASEYLIEYLQAYVDVYLTDEIRNEGLVRNLAGFARFLDVAGLCNGDMINFTNIARDCGVDRSTVQGFYQILIDTLLGYYIYPFNKKIKRDLILATPKFYLFDVGIANYLAKQTVNDLKGYAAGKSFEHYILMELIAFLHINRKRLDIYYWRTKTGLEVDFILGKALLAIEVKINKQVHQQELAGLIAFGEEHPEAKLIVVSQDPKPRQLEINNNQNIRILPWKDFLEKLWSGELI